MNVAPPAKRKCQKTKMLNLQQIIEDTAGQPIPIKFDKIGMTCSPIGVDQKYFPCLIGSLVRMNIEPFHKSWASVPDEQKAKIAPRLHVRHLILL